MTRRAWLLVVLVFVVAWYLMGVALSSLHLLRD